VLAVSEVRRRELIDPLLSDVSDRYESKPASVSISRAVEREFFSRLSDLTELEKEIIQWDRHGRSEEDLERLRKSAWSFTETGRIASRRRLFAGFITNQADTDGYAAEYLFDFAVGMGLAPEEVHEIMMRHNP
jgi:hypothetical protein